MSATMRDGVEPTARSMSHGTHVLPESQRTTASRWNEFAAREPFYAVLSSPLFLTASLSDERIEEFYQSGEQLVAWMLGVVDPGIAPRFAAMSVLEFGCGPGRLALPLARRFPSVTCVDNSPAMLEVLRKQAGQRGIDNLTVLSLDEFAATQRKFDLVVCHQVMQRLSRRDGCALLEQLAQRVAPDGIGIFQFPFRARRSALDRVQRWARGSVPAANVLANRLKGRPASFPAVRTTVFGIETVQRIFPPSEFRRSTLEFAYEQDLDTATLFAHKLDQGRVPQLVAVAKEPDGHDTSDSPSPEEIAQSNETAELYFSSLSTWDHHLAKPFSQVEETPTLLANLAVLLGAAALQPGMRVLEFGAGSGWLSRSLSQSGCRVTVLDVSNTALDMAKELYRRLPPIGHQPSPEFALFDGVTLPFPANSFDRVICFDAFHHALNPYDVIREFGRVLDVDGRAVFAEPGPRHSDSDRSRFETTTYGVVEKDVDIHRIWRVAQTAGFNDLRMCVFNARAHHVSLADYEDLLAGGQAQEAWNASSRLFLRYVRNFYLSKGTGASANESADDHGWRAAIEAPHTVTGTESAPTTLTVRVENIGTAVWPPSDGSHAAVFLGAHLYDGAGRVLNFDFAWAALANPPRAVAPGERVLLDVALPRLARGRYLVELDCVSAGVTWFAQKGSQTVRLSLDITPQ